MLKSKNDSILLGNDAIYTHVGWGEGINTSYSIMFQGFEHESGVTSLSENA